jgi:uncharacterized protein YunC (DUF1805 family)
LTIEKVVTGSEGRKIVVAESAADMDEGTRGVVFVNGSHCGVNVAAIAIQGGVAAVIGNDAGLGKNNAGIAALALLDEKGIPVAAVAAMTARIGSGLSTYEDGKVSAVNESARRLGVSVGMSAREAANKLSTDL